jgi:hypothetical protein
MRICMGVRTSFVIDETRVSRLDVRYSVARLANKNGVHGLNLASFKGVGERLGISFASISVLGLFDCKGYSSYVVIL